MLTAEELKNAVGAVLGVVQSAVGRKLKDHEVHEPFVPGKLVQVTTPDGTAKLVASIPVAAGRAVSIGVRVWGIRTSNADRYYLEKSFVYENEGGTLTQVGSDSDAFSRDDGTWTGLTHTDNGTDVEISVTGPAAEVKWYVRVWYAEAAVL